MKIFKFLGIQPTHKVGYMFAMVVVFMLPHMEFGLNDHREDAPHFTKGTRRQPVMANVP